MQKKKLLAAILTGVFLTSSVILSGCSKSPEPSNTPEAKMDAVQTLNLMGYDPKTLDASLASDGESFTVIAHVFEGLVNEVMKDGVVTTELAGAESIKTNEDKTVYTIKLKDSKWSDGKPVTAQQYEFSFKRQADPTNGSDYLSYLKDISVKGADEFNKDKTKKDGVMVKALDEKTLQITLEGPTAYFESALAFKGLVPIREDLVKAQGDAYGSDYSKLVYNGPYIISDYKKGSQMTYKKNPTYWNAKAVKLDTVNALILEEPTTLTKMFRGKELDSVGASKDDIASLKKEAESGLFKYFPGTQASAFYNYFNNKSKIFSSPKVRLAASLAFNRQQFLDVAFKRNFAANGIVPSGISIGTKDYRKEVAEPLLAVKDDPKKLLEEGLKDLGITDISKVEVKMLLGKQNSLSKTIGEYTQKVFKDNLGLNIKLNFSVDSPTYFDDRVKGKFDICAGGWTADFNDVSSFFTMFTSDNNNNNGKYNNPEYDKLVNGASKETDPAKRLASYKKAEELIVAKDAGIMPTYYADIQNFRQNYVKDLYIPKFGGYYDFTRAYISGKEQ